MLTKKRPSPHWLLHKMMIMRNGLSLILFACLLSACSEPHSTDKSGVNTPNIKFKQSAKLIKIQPSESYIVDRTYLGQIKSKQDAKLSFEYAGTVNNVLADVGDVVQKNQILATQNTEVLTFKEKELQARLNQTQAQIKLNLANLERIQSLTKDGYSSQQRLDELNAENEVLTASVLGLRAQIEALNYQISKTTLTAPFDGVITRKALSTGEHTSPSRAVFQIIKQSDREITLGVPAALAASLQKGSLLTVEINNAEHQGKILSVSQHINSINRTVQLRLKLTSKVNSFDGQLVKVHINKVVKAHGYWLPLTALTDGVRGQWQVFLALENEHTLTNENDLNENDRNKNDLNNNIHENGAVQSPKNKIKPVFTLQSATVKVLYTNKSAVYITGLPDKNHTVVKEGLHRFVSGQSVHSLSGEGLK